MRQKFPVPFCLKGEEMNVGFISLGCSKNLIDTEITIGKFKEHNYNIVNDEKEADILVINTCGFIDSAKEEAINTILEMAEYKEKRCKYLIVMGCLVQRYGEELKKLLPEVDLFIKPVPNKNIQKINGFVYYATQQQSDEEKFRAVVLRNIHLVRFHRQLSDSLSADTLALPDSLINDSLKQTMPVDSILLQDSVKSMDMPAGGRHQGSPIDYKRKRKR